MNQEKNPILEMSVRKFLIDCGFVSQKIYRALSRYKDLKVSVIYNANHTQVPGLDYMSFNEFKDKVDEIIKRTSSDNEEDETISDEVQEDVEMSGFKKKILNMDVDEFLETYGYITVRISNAVHRAVLTDPDEQIKVKWFYNNFGKIRNIGPKSWGKFRDAVDEVINSYNPDQQKLITNKEEKMEKQNIVVISEERLISIMNKVVSDQFDKRLYEVRGAQTQKEYLSTRDLREKYGLSHRAQQHHRDEGNIEFVQDGRKVLYPVEAVEKFFSQRKVKAKED